MDLHEFQAKEIISRYGIAIPPGRIAGTAEEALAAAREIASKTFAVKAQVHAGGRGRAGGVRLVKTTDAVRSVAGELLGSVLVTDQTGPRGRAVRQVYVEAVEQIARPVYVAAIVDQRSGELILIGAPEGGDDIELRAAEAPDALEILPIDLSGAAPAGDFGGFAARLGFDGELAAEAARLFETLVTAFVELDAALVEINPLAVTPDGRLVALDVKMALDDNALARHPELEALRDRDALDPIEMEAQRHDMNFVRLDGDIGVAANGAGLALATNDMLIDAGGRPANFMDIRTTASSVQISRGFDLIFATPGVKAVLVNIHGGGMTPCDTIAEGLGMSAGRTSRKLPLVLRAAGNNADHARTVLRNCGVSFFDAADIAMAVNRVVALASGRARS